MQAKQNIKMSRFEDPRFSLSFFRKNCITIKCLRHEGKIAEERTALTIPEMLKTVWNIFVGTGSIAHVAEHVYVTQKSVFCGCACVTSSAPRWCSFKRIFFSSKWVKNRGRPSKTRASLSLSPCKMISCRWTSLDLHLTQKIGAWDRTLSPFVYEDTDLVWNKEEDWWIRIKKKDYLFIKNTFWNVRVTKLRIKCLVPLWGNIASGPYSRTQMVCACHTFWSAWTLKSCEILDYYKKL